MKTKFLILTVACALLNTDARAQRGPDDFTIVGSPEKLPTASAPRRYTVRIRVPFGKSRQVVQALLERVAQEQQRALNANALTVFAYRPGDPVNGIYSVGEATIAPFGDWSRAGEQGPLRTTVTLRDEYFAGDPSKATGTMKVLTSEGALKTISLSRRFESWGDADIVARIRVGTTVQILETRTSGPYVTRFRIRVKSGGKVVEGWVHDNNVK